MPPLSCYHHATQSKRHQAKGRIKGAAHLALQTVKAHDPHMELPQVPQAEAWSVQVFRTIDSGE